MDKPALDDILAPLVPVHGAAVAVRSNGHLASDGRAESDFEGAIGFFAAAHAIEEILQVRFGRVSDTDNVGGRSGRFALTFRTLLTLGNVANLVQLLAKNCTLVAQQQVSALPVKIVAKHRIPGEEGSFRIVPC